MEFKYEPTSFHYVIHHDYTPDFYIPHKDLYIETKGKLDDETKRKMVAVKKTYPDLDIRFVFMRAGNRIKGSKTTYGEWATKNGYTWADGKIPVEWLT